MNELTDGVNDGLRQLTNGLQIITGTIACATSITPTPAGALAAVDCYLFRVFLLETYGINTFYTFVDEAVVAAGVIYEWINENLWGITVCTGGYQACCDSIARAMGLPGCVARAADGFTSLRATDVVNLVLEHWAARSDVAAIPLR